MVVHRQPLLLLAACCLVLAVGCAADTYVFSPYHVRSCRGGVPCRSGCAESCSADGKCAGGECTPFANACGARFCGLAEFCGADARCHRDTCAARRAECTAAKGQAERIECPRGSNYTSCEATKDRVFSCSVGNELLEWSCGSRMGLGIEDPDVFEQRRRHEIKAGKQQQHRQQQKSSKQQQQQQQSSKVGPTDYSAPSSSAAAAPPRRTLQQMSRAKAGLRPQTGAAISASGHSMQSAMTRSGAKPSGNSWSGGGLGAAAGLLTGGRGMGGLMSGLGTVLEMGSLGAGKSNAANNQAFDSVAAAYNSGAALGLGDSYGFPPNSQEELLDPNEKYAVLKGGAFANQAGGGNYNPYFSNYGPGVTASTTEPQPSFNSADGWPNTSNQLGGIALVALDRTYWPDAPANITYPCPEGFGEGMQIGPGIPCGVALTAIPANMLPTLNCGGATGQAPPFGGIPCAPVVIPKVPISGSGGSGQPIIAPAPTPGPVPVGGGVISPIPVITPPAGGGGVISPTPGATPVAGATPVPGAFVPVPSPAPGATPVTTGPVPVASQPVPVAGAPASSPVPVRPQWVWVDNAWVWTGEDEAGVQESGSYQDQVRLADYRGTVGVADGLGLVCLHHQPASCLPLNYHLDHHYHSKTNTLITHPSCTAPCTSPSPSPPVCRTQQLRRRQRRPPHQPPPPRSSPARLPVHPRRGHPPRDQSVHRLRAGHLCRRVAADVPQLQPRVRGGGEGDVLLQALRRGVVRAHAGLHRVLPVRRGDDQRQGGVKVQGGGSGGAAGGARGGCCCCSCSWR